MTLATARSSRAFLGLGLSIASLLAAAPGSAAPSPEQLANATFAGIFESPVRLRDGVYEGEPYVAGGAARPRLQLVSEPVVRADLDDDGVEEAVVLVAASSGGSGSRLHLAVVGLRKDSAASLATILIGDRVQPRSLDAGEGRIRMELVDHGPGEPACCPTRVVIREWRFEAAGSPRLYENRMLVLGTISPLDLVGPDWRLARIGETPVPDGSEITAAFSADGISGSAGCNRYFGSFTSSAPATLSMGPLGTTRRMCPLAQMELETRFLTALGSSDNWRLAANRLTLRGDGESLLFIHPETTEQATQAPLQRVRGHLVLGHEVRSFTPCGSEVDFWVIDRTGSDLGAAYRELATSPYEELYVELFARVAAVPKAEFGADSVGGLVVLELRRVARETAGCSEDQTGYAFAARGNEPFWRLEIRDDQMRFTEPGAPASRTFPIDRSQISGETRSYATRAPEAAGIRVEIDLVEERCVDTMSGERLPYTAWLRIGDRNLRGCASEGRSVATDLAGMTATLDPWIARFPNEEAKLQE